MNEVRCGVGRVLNGESGVMLGGTISYRVPAEEEEERGAFGQVVAPSGAALGSVGLSVWWLVLLVSGVQVLGSHIAGAWRNGLSVSMSMSK